MKQMLTSPFLMAWVLSLSLSLFPPAGIRLKSLLRVSRDLRCNEVSLLRRSVHFSTCFFPNKPCFTLLKYSKPISAMSQDTFSRLDSSKNHGWSGADKGMEKWREGPLEQEERERFFLGTHGFPWKREKINQYIFLCDIWTLFKRNAFAKTTCSSFLKFPFFPSERQCMARNRKFLGPVSKLGLLAWLA